MQKNTYVKNSCSARTVILSVLSLCFFHIDAQMITGVWHGKIDNEKLEVKMIQTGDSITGTSYYYESASRYRRYIIKGYFDETDNSVVWWDDQLIEDKTKGLTLFSRKKRGESKADFNCPGPGVMMLDGKMYAEEDQNKPRGDVHLDKTETILFKDEWDYIIKNYTVGANDPDIIDSVSAIAQQPNAIVNPVDTSGRQPKSYSPIAKNEGRNERDPIKNEIVSVPVTKQEAKIGQAIAAPTIEQKFAGRE